ncbi:ThiF family adenylyltransferase [Candidatus Woesearchaeota archaeon]|nr:ThiF family adenylyltransferase [Candidatus Woesearchaeota archaeon]
MRYAQNTKFKEIGDKGQKILEDKNVAIVGLGNVGSTVAHMLLRSGINLRLIDKGRVDLTELSSQMLYLEEDHSKFKAKQAKKYLEEINPKVKVRTFHEDLTKNNAYLIDADVVIDATGDLETSKLISAETKKKTILIYAAVSGSKGLIITTDKGVALDKIKPILDKMKPIKEVGIISPAVHMAAAIIATRTIKNLLKKGSAKDNVQFDVWNDTFKKQKA